MANIEQPEKVSMEQFIEKYVKFADGLVKAEKEAKLPTDKQSTPERIHEAFRFWYVDCRDREDLARAMALDERDREEEREYRKKTEDRLWEND